MEFFADFRQGPPGLGKGGGGCDGQQRGCGGTRKVRNGACDGVFSALDIGHVVFSRKGGRAELDWLGPGGALSGRKRAARLAG